MPTKKTLSAREAFDDCLTFYDTHLRPMMKLQTGDATTGRSFDGALIPADEFCLKATVTHAALTVLVKRYPSAEFEFHDERTPLPGATTDDVRENPLHTQSVTVTLDFTPYGIRVGGSFDGGGGAGSKTSDTQPMSAPTLGGPSGPGTTSPTSPSSSKVSG